MHIPNGFLDFKTIASTTAVSGAALAVAVSKTNKTLNNKQIPFMGVMAAFIFAAQMVNFPIIGGTSGHLIGGALATALFGPAMASIIISTVLFVQCIVFQDGGLTVLGVNIFNMAVVAVYTSYVIYYITSKIFKVKKGKAISIFIASWTSVVVAAFAAALELAISRVLPLKLALVAMLGWHVFIGIGEGLITTFVLVYINKLDRNAQKNFQDAR